jgi:predicted nucleotide-binding protein (sugar kinase/HSP70/actin superfamily)
LICLEHIWKDIKAGLDEIKGKHPNFADIAAHEVFQPGQCEERRRPHSDSEILEQDGQSKCPLLEKRKKLRVGIRRVLNTYTYAPLFNEYLEVQEMVAD